jgi:hypothetical protein
LSDTGKLPYNPNFNYSHNFSRMKQHLHAILASSDEPFQTVEEANYYREKVKEAANSALCYIPLEHDK